MEYHTDDLRRKERALERARAEELLRAGSHGVLSMQAETGRGAYGVPLNYVWDGQQTLFLHCARAEGRKLRCIRACPDVSFCVIASATVLPNKFTTQYESIVLACEAHVVEDEGEKRRALSMIVDKFSADFKAQGEKMIAGVAARTDVIRLDVKQWCGKANKGM
eukprot:m51a1_g5292 hypothetical protein (164) ;mRNA; f:210914-211523